LTFDFSSAPLSPSKKRDVEKLVNEKVAENATFRGPNFHFAEAKQRKTSFNFSVRNTADNVRCAANRWVAASA
jgi:alanyl-tRNA synthetase